MLVGTQVEAEVVVMTTMTEDLVTVLLTFSKMEVATTEVVRPETNCCEASSSKVSYKKSKCMVTVWGVL